MEDIQKKLKWLRNFDAIAKSKREELTKMQNSIKRSSYFLEQNGQEESSARLQKTLQTKTKKIADELEDMYQDREHCIEMIGLIRDPVYQLVVRLYYLHGESWNRISRQVPGSINTLRKYRNKGLEEIGLNMTEKISVYTGVAQEILSE